MLTIWKAPLNGVDEQTIQVPVGADLLSAREQGDGICVWYRCDPAQETKEARTILIRGTGHMNVPGAEAARFLGTVSLLSGRLIFHVFEQTKTVN